MVKRKDSFWDHVVNLGNGHFRCNFCGKEFCGGVLRIKDHLSGNKGWDTEICEKLLKETQLEAPQVIGSPSKRAKTMATSTSVSDSESMSSCSTVGMPNSKRMDASEVDTLYAKYIIANRVLFDGIGSTSFTNFVNGVAEYGFGYERPSSLVIKSQLIPKIRKEVWEYTHNAIESAREKGCTLYYSSCLSSIFAYTPKGVVLIDSSFSRGKSEMEIIFSAIQITRPTSVVQLITDRDKSSITNAVFERFPSILHTTCAMHETKYVLGVICQKPLVRNILSLAIMIDHFICKYKIKVQAQHKWGDYWDLHKLTSLQGIERRYERGVNKLTSLLEVESKLRGLRISIQFWSIERYKIGTRGATYFKNAKYIDFLIHCEEFWRQGKLVVGILQPVVEALYLVVDSGSSFGQLYEAMEKIKDAARECCEKDDNFNYVQFVKESLGIYMSRPILSVAAFLNPTCTCRRELKEDSALTRGIGYVRDHVVKEDEKEIFMNQVEQYLQILSKTSTNEVTTESKATQARIWWDLYGSDLHVLKRYAIRILEQPCSSSFRPQYQLREGFRGDLPFAINTMLMERHKSPETQMLESTVSSEQYEREYGHVISWFKKNFSKIEHDPTFSWLKEEAMQFGIESDNED